MLRRMILVRSLRQNYGQAERLSLPRASAPAMGPEARLIC